MKTEHDPWPEGYGQYDVASIDAVTLIRDGGDKAVLFMTAVDGLKVCMVVPLGDLCGAVRQIVGHTAPVEIMSKGVVVINGGKVA